MAGRPFVSVSVRLVLSFIVTTALLLWGAPLWLALPIVLALACWVAVAKEERGKAGERPIEWKERRLFNEWPVPFWVCVAIWLGHWAVTSHLAMGLADSLLLIILFVALHNDGRTSYLFAEVRRLRESAEELRNLRDAIEKNRPQGGPQHERD